MPAEKPQKPVNALARGIAILRHLNARDEPVGVMQIARDLKINPSTCFNLLRTLAHERLAVFDPASKKYTSGLGVLELASGVLKRGGYARLAHPALEQIANKHAVTVMLWQLISPSRVLLVDLAEAPVPVRVHMTVGQRLPSLVGALGRCIAAFSDMSREQVRAMFNELRWQNPPTFTQYWADVEAARRDGYAVDAGNYSRNFTTVATPILGPDGQARMAISVITFLNDSDAKRLHRLAVDLRATGESLSRALGNSDFPQSPSSLSPRPLADARKRRKTGATERRPRRKRADAVSGRDGAQSPPARRGD